MHAYTFRVAHTLPCRLSEEMTEKLVRLEGSPADFSLLRLRRSPVDGVLGRRRILTIEESARSSANVILRSI